MAVKFDPLLNKLREKDVIPEVTSDPASPKAQEAWVLDTASGGNDAGNPIGLLLALTYPAQTGVSHTYQLSYQTKEGTTVRVTLS